jgi:hypothetical protein
MSTLKVPRWVWMTVIASCILSLGCNEKPATDSVLGALHGEQVAVFVRHDLLGQASEIPSSLEAGAINGANVAVYGRLMNSSSDWIVIETSKETWTIPWTSVLALRQIRVPNGTDRQVQAQEARGEHGKPEEAP